MLFLLEIKPDFVLSYLGTVYNHLINVNKTA